MKNLATIILITIISLSTYAQDQKDRSAKHDKNPMEHFTPEQRNQLMLKKMTLELDLNASQQKEMGKLIAEQSAKREAFMKNRKEKTERPTSDQIFEMKSKMLDEQIEMKSKMKKTLSADQFKKWEEMKKNHGDDRRHDGPQDVKKDRRHKGEDQKK